MNGPHVSLPVIQILYGILHSMKGDTFMRKLLEQAIEGTSFAFTQLMEMDNEVERLRADNERLRKLFATPPANWSERDRLFVNKQ